MTPLKTLKAAVLELNKRNLKYCLIGGHAASLYRKNERLTKDVDFALMAIPPEKSRQSAEAVIKAIGFSPIVGFFPDDSTTHDTSGIRMVTSKPEEGSFTGIIDILLPKLPWVKNAVERAQANMIDLGFSEVPVIAPEDLIIAKCYALRNSPTRFQDLDDIKEIFEAIPADLDYDYILVQLRELNLQIPKIIKPHTPKVLKKLCK